MLAVLPTDVSPPEFILLAPGIGTRRRGCCYVALTYPSSKHDGSVENESLQDHCCFLLHVWVIFHIDDKVDGRGRVSWNGIESCCIMSFFPVSM